MTTAQLLSLADAVAKDSGSTKEYSATIKYLMLSIAQESIASVVHESLITHLVARATGTFTSGVFTLPTDWLRPMDMWDSTNAVAIKWIDPWMVAEMQYNDQLHGGDDFNPRYTVLKYATGLQFRLYATNTTRNVEYFYIARPANIDAGTEPSIYGLDDLIIAHFKWQLHVAEGQPDLAAAALKMYEDMVITRNNMAMGGRRGDV